MDKAYTESVLRVLELLRVEIISAVTPQADQVAANVERYVRSYLTPSGGRGE